VSVVLCPVCFGRGRVALKFYEGDASPRGPGPTTYCVSCCGRGVVVTPDCPDPVVLPNAPRYVPATPFTNGPIYDQAERRQLNANEVCARLNGWPVPPRGAVPPTSPEGTKS
jgi:hypothetical protein